MSPMPNRSPKLTLAAGAFAMYFPKMSAHYRSLQKDLLAHHPHLKEPFKGGSFAAITFNLGGEVAAIDHTDVLNNIEGQCGTVADGNYDYQLGGHLILWDLGIAVEFPPGRLIFFPSSIIKHSNTAIQPGEVRRSFTMYTAGSLFRWKAYGFQSQESMEKNPERKHAMDARRPHAWSNGLTLYSMLDELASDLTDAAHISSCM
jgi:hypothetical protein